MPPVYAQQNDAARRLQNRSKAGSADESSYHGIPSTPVETTTAQALINSPTTAETLANKPSIWDSGSHSPFLRANAAELQQEPVTNPSPGVLSPYNVGPFFNAPPANSQIGPVMGPQTNLALTSNFRFQSGEVQGNARIEEILDDGNDFDVSEGDLDEIHDVLADLPPAERNEALSQLSSKQLDVLFHNVHSSGFFSNDWNTTERHEFYQLVGSADNETLARISEHSPVPIEHLKAYQGASDVEGNYDISWSNTDIARWQAGDGEHLFNEKSRYIEGNRDIFNQAAEQYDIPPLLLAGVGFTEFGGDPLWIDSLAQNVREFDYSGPDWIDNNLTVTGHPNFTSHGNMSVQVRVAAEALGYDPNNLSGQQRDLVITSLQDPKLNIFVAAKHISDLSEIDHPGVSAENMTRQQLNDIATRYNRGGSLSIEQIRSNPDYGDDLLGHEDEINAALAGEFEADD